MHNLLTDPLIRFIAADGSMKKASLPGILAALARDGIASFPALRPHQIPAWHMFLVQLAALALHRAGQKAGQMADDLPENADEWRRLIRALTPGFPDDEPWRLVVEDWSRPAFMQPPVPDGVALKGLAETPDALDMVITSKNHDLKQAVAGLAEPDDWIFSLVSLQTGEGYGGAGNHGIARMNGGSSSRVCMGLIPLPDGRYTPGQRFGWDTQKLLRGREQHVSKIPAIGYPPQGGLALLWTLPWPEKQQLSLDQLDIWFIEICRRVRLEMGEERLLARTGTSKAARIDAKAYNGVTGDPWAPVNVKDNKSLTIGEGTFDYKRISNLLFGADWALPPMLQLNEQEKKKAGSWLLIAQAIGRGNSKTYGYHERLLPVSPKVVMAFGLMKVDKTLGDLANNQIEEIAKFKNALGGAIALFVKAGDGTEVNQDAYKFAGDYQERLDQKADELFFPSLWKRYEAEDDDSRDQARLEFLKELYDAALKLLEEAAGSLPCPSIYRHRARIRAISRFKGMMAGEKTGLPQLRGYIFPSAKEQENDAA